MSENRRFTLNLPLKTVDKKRPVIIQRHHEIILLPQRDVASLHAPSNQFGSVKLVDTSSIAIAVALAENPAAVLLDLIFSSCVLG